MNENEEAKWRLAEVVDLLNCLPILHASSSREPEATVRLIDLTKVGEVAQGITSRSEWVSVPCASTLKFGHSPHHWSEYREGEVPLRVPHYCDGKSREPADV